MGTVTMWKCDHCDKRVDNPYQHRGWISIGDPGKQVSVGRATGVFGKSAYESDYLSKVSDFCSIDCLVAALDKKAREREDQKIEEEKKTKELRS
jgi:hypothetical protein